MTQASSASSFLFVAVRPGGGRRLGLRQAASQRALADVLRRDSLLLLRCWELPRWLRTAGAGKKMSARDQATLNEVLSRLLSRGVPLVEALEATSQAVRPQAHERVHRMRELVAAGASLAAACERVGGFDAVTVAVYRGAERTGELGDAAAQLARSVRRRLEVSGKAVTVLMYPVIVLSLSLLLGFAMMVWIVPRLSASMRDLTEGNLNWFSAAVFALGEWMQANLFAIVLVFLLAVLLGVIGRRAVIATVQEVMQRAPVIRGVVLLQESARFFSVMAALTRSGVPLADALAVGNEAVTHPVLRRQLSRLRTRLIGGGVFPTLINEVTALPVDVRQLLVAGDKSGDLDETFGSLAEDMSLRLDTATTRLVALIQPMAVIFMAVVIGSVIFAIMLPVITMASRVAQ